MLFRQAVTKFRICPASVFSKRRLFLFSAFGMGNSTLLVLSDSHGNVSALEAVFRWVKLLPEGTIGAAVFLGDGCRDISRAAAATGFSREWKLIRGNNDDSFSAPESAVLDFCGHRFFLCHGHRLSLYGGSYRLTAAARNMEANTALFGHTHLPHCEYAEGILLVNPGSIGRPRSRAGSTFALVECAEPSLEVQFWAVSPEKEIRNIRIT